MGVIHKLKEEVVFFITTHKKNDPSISVRQLADMTSRQFQLNVSKSSVNSVLKRALLSSSVGRRSGSTVRPEKFSIPSTKKKEISERMSRAGFINEKLSLNEKQSDAKPVAEKKEARHPPKSEKEKTIVPERPVKENSCEVQRIDETPPQEQKSLPMSLHPHRQENRQGIPVPGGMGFIFLKAAQWETSNRSLMGELLTKHIHLPVSGHFDAVSDMFLFFTFLKAETLDHISAYRGHGLWVLNDFCDSPANEAKDLLEMQELFQWSRTVTAFPLLSSLAMDYKRAKDQALLEVRGFTLSLEDGSALAMDAAMSSFVGGWSIPTTAYGTLPMDKALGRLSNCLVSNIQNAVFRAAPGGERLDRSFYDLIAIFENIPGKRILRTDVLDAGGQKIATFSTVPSKKRTLLIGIGPQHKEFTELIKTAKWAGKKSFYHGGTGRTIYFSETKTDFIAGQIQEKIGEYRVIAVWEDGGSGGPYWAVLTNQRHGSGEEILKTYVSYWPYLDGRTDDAPVVLPRAEEEENDTNALNSVSDICSDFIEALHGYCQKNFFPPAHSNIDVNNLITNIYEIPGIFYRSGNEITVFLEIDADSIYRKDLEYAVKRVNERNIFDYSGRRIWLQV